jgi:hypothetical protein
LVLPASTPDALIGSIERGAAPDPLADSDLDVLACDDDSDDGAWRLWGLPTLAAAAG